jgi:hypothetical protein
MIFYPENPERCYPQEIICPLSGNKCENKIIRSSVMGGHEDLVVKKACIFFDYKAYFPDGTEPNAPVQNVNPEIIELLDNQNEKERDWEMIQRFCNVVKFIKQGIKH